MDARGPGPVEVGVGVLERVGEPGHLLGDDTSLGNERGRVKERSGWRDERVRGRERGRQDASLLMNAEAGVEEDRVDVDPDGKIERHCGGRTPVRRGAKKTERTCFRKLLALNVFVDNTG